MTVTATIIFAGLMFAIYHFNEKAKKTAELKAKYWRARNRAFELHAVGLISDEDLILFMDELNSAVGERGLKVV